MQFNYYMPTRIVSGEGCITANAALFDSVGKNAFIMCGPSSAAKNGSLKDVCAALDSRGISWTICNKVRPNPSIEEARDAAAEARQANADFIVAIGGGSPMDAAKAVALMAGCNPPDEVLFKQNHFERVLPLVAIPTTAGTGSEVTPYSILTNDRIQSKSILSSPQLFPRIAFLDARYTMELPIHITAATAVDAMSHAIEGYLAVRSIPLARSLALDALTRIGPILPSLARAEAQSLEKRQELLYASTLAGMVIAQTGTTAVHAMGYSLTYFKGIDHGAANGLLMASYLEFIAGTRAEEIARILQALGCKSIRALGDSIASLFDPLSISDTEIQDFAAIAITAGNIKNTKPEPSKEDLVYMLTKSRKD